MTRKFETAMEAYDYAYEHGRCAEAEEMILEDRGWIYLYAKHVIKDRWPEGELLIPCTYAVLYAEEFNLDINIKFSERKKNQMNRRNLLKTVLGGLASLLLPVKFTQAKSKPDLKAVVVVYYPEGRHYIKKSDGSLKLIQSKGYYLVYTSTQNDLASFFKEAADQYPAAKTVHVHMKDVLLNRAVKLKEEGKRLKVDYCRFRSIRENFYDIAWKQDLLQEKN